jgi:dCMP deaminase
MRLPQKKKLMLDVALRMAYEATCPRMNGGAVIATDDFHILTTGFNGAPRGLPHCLDAGCHLIDGHCGRASHAEMNAILQAARIGLSVHAANLYCTHFPCPMCARMIVQVGLVSVTFIEYPPTYPEEQVELVKGWFRYKDVRMTQSDGLELK